MAKKVHLGSISFLILIFAASASAATPACGTHLTSDTTYVFDQDLNCTGGGISQALLYASNRHNITVDCAGYKIINKGTWNYGFRIGLFNQPSRNITIKDCEIVNVSTGTGGYGIRLDGTNRTLQDENITIVNTTISFNDTTGNSYWGISGSYSGNVTIDNVTILARGDGIELHDCGDVLIQDCNISGGQSNGVELLSWGATNGGYYATNTTIEDCNITGMGGQGIYLVYYSGVDVRGNNLSGNGVGMSIFGPAENINVSHNEMFNNTQRGISIFANLWPAVNRDFVISYNNITHTSNGPGLDMENSLNGTLVSFNNISHNSGHGVDADGIYLGDDIAFRNNTITFNDYAGLYLTGVYDDLGLYGNTVCSNGLAGGYSDIHAVDTVYGDDNTCESTAGYADDGRFGGCDTSCTGCVDADMDGFYPTPGCIEPLDCDDADASRIPAREDLVIDRDIVLCPGTYYLDDEAEDGVLSVRAPSVTLDCNGAVFIGDYDPDDYLFPTCIYIDKDNVTVKNCDITQYDSGIDSGAQNATVLNNTIANTSSGITVRDANNTVRGNTVSNSVQGIEAYFESSEISDNVLEDTVVGIYLSHPQSSTISGNTITSDITEFTREILEEFSDPELTYGIFIRVYDGEASDNDIYENTISGSDYGIALNEMEEEGSFSSNDVSRNDISGCVFGI